MKKVLFWILAVAITLGSAIYQRKTGPTYPKDFNISLGNKQFEFELPTSGETNVDHVVLIPTTDTSISVILNYKRFPVNEAFNRIEFQRTNEGLIAYLPQQPPAGK